MSSVTSFTSTSHCYLACCPDISNAVFSTSFLPSTTFPTATCLRIPSFQKSLPLAFTSQTPFFSTKRTISFSFCIPPTIKATPLPRMSSFRDFVKPKHLFTCLSNACRWPLLKSANYNTLGLTKHQQFSKTETASKEQKLMLHPTAQIKVSFLLKMNKTFNPKF